MAVTGKKRTIHHKFSFAVEFDRLSSFFFNKCSELSFEVAKVEYWEGGAIVSHKTPGRVTNTDITLSRGAGDDFDAYDWAREVVDFVEGGGKAGDDIKRQGGIVQKDRAGSELRRWQVFNAWPMKFSAGDWDNDADEVVIEEMVLVNDGFQRATS